MIEFACHCGNIFRLDDDDAGMEIQCSHCGRLNDVPLPSDLKKISDDGTFQLDEAPVLDDPKKAAELLYVYSRHERDADGHQKDMRLTDEEAQHIGVGEHAHIANEKILPHGPRYDPETGALVKEIELAPREARKAPVGGVPDAIPMASINYATGATPSGNLSFQTAFLKLFEPGSMVVMGALLLMHLLSLPMIGIIFHGFFPLALVAPVVVVIIFSHYGNVVDEVGPGNHDELARPLRDLHFYDDLWHPFCNVAGSLLLSYFPMILAVGLIRNAIVPPAAGALIGAILAGVGSFFFPAIFITLQTSGTPVNLRPDRVLRLIAVSGPLYFVLTGLWMAAVFTYSWGIFGQSIAIFLWLGNMTLPWPLHWGLTMAVLLTGIFLTHYFCFCLGLLYRAHHADFPWAWQHHVRTTPAAVVAAPRTPRRNPNAPRR